MASRTWSPSGRSTAACPRRRLATGMPVARSWDSDHGLRRGGNTRQGTREARDLSCQAVFWRDCSRCTGTS
eukprot:12331877-Prorocentrum_lima.AAC.1